MFSSKPKKGAASIAAPVVKAAEPVERSILRDCANALATARQRAADSEAECERLGAIIAEGAKSEERLASLIGGAEIGPDDALMRSSVALEISARAAKIRLPRARTELEDGRRAAMQAEAQRNVAARNVMLVEAAKLAMQHREHWRELCRLNDELLGISAALPPLDPISEPIHDASMPMEVRSSSLARFVRHITDEAEIASARARWAAASAALLDDPDTDIAAALAAPVTLSPPSHLPPGMTQMPPRDGSHAGQGRPVGPFGQPLAVAEWELRNG
jgi:hypothetical protein